jgi:hypothetical protein
MAPEPSSDTGDFDCREGLSRDFPRAGDENRTRVLSLGKQYRADLDESQRTSADGITSSEPVAEQGRIPADFSACAIKVPWREVRIELPDAVLRGLERDADKHGVSVEMLICAILVRNQTGLDDGPGAEK